jgi:hypothetical protein
MKKILPLAAAAVLGGVSLSAAAWYWGPYGYPYYAPVLPLPAPGYALSQEQIDALAERQPAAVPWAGAVPGWGPYVGGPGDYLSDPFVDPWMREMFRQSEVEREQALRVSEARRAAARARAEAQRLAMEARRRAFRESAGGYGYRYGPLALAPAAARPPAAEAPPAGTSEPAAEAPADEPTPEPKAD